MGTTLDNGTYLPDEGERNCYEGLAGNWVALDNHLGSTNIHVTINDKQAWNGHVADSVKHVTAADKEAWNGKADASALTAHTGDTAIHVTAEDKAKWDAVTSKADDSGVMHLTGNETSTGFKQFANIRLTDSIRAINLDNQTVDLNNCYSTFTPSGSTGNGNIQYYCCNTNGATANIFNLPEKVSFFLESVTLRVVTGVAHVKQTVYCYGNKTYVRYYNGTTWTSWNNIHDELEPSALGMPDLSKGIDISSYITHLDKVVNNYTPPANGWLSIRIRKTSLVDTSLMMYQPGGLLSSCETEFNISGANLPVIANQNVEIYIYADALVTAKFYPCQGNV